MAPPREELSIRAIRRLQQMARQEGDEKHMSLMYIAPSYCYTTQYRKSKDATRKSVYTHQRCPFCLLYLGYPLIVTGLHASITCGQLKGVLWFVASAYSNDCPGSNGCLEHDSCDSNPHSTPDLETIELEAVLVKPSSTRSP